MTPPAFRSDELAGEEMDAALLRWGGFFVDVSGWDPLPARMLEVGRAFFALPRDQKAALTIGRSSRFRGWSELHNERDWREQLHLAREDVVAENRPGFQELQGPNLWPADTGWQALVVRYVEATARLGQEILLRLARVLGVSDVPFATIAGQGHWVGKLISYHPQSSGAALPRSGVAPHVDFSWVTLNLQDAGGLEICCPDGTWLPLGVRPGQLWLHAGELLEHATRGRYPATPHRVVNHSADRPRLSIPFFVNPPLDAIVPVFALTGRSDLGRDDSAAHVHRVLAPGEPRSAFHFGEAEWRRKGQGGWCHLCSPVVAS